MSFPFNEFTEFALSYPRVSWRATSRTPGTTRGFQSSTCRLDMSTFSLERLFYCVVSGTTTTQVELRSG